MGERMNENMSENAKLTNFHLFVVCVPFWCFLQRLVLCRCVSCVCRRVKQGSGVFQECSLVYKPPPAPL